MFTTKIGPNSAVIINMYLQFQTTIGKLQLSNIPMRLWKLSVLEIPLDKELTANWLVETRTKLEELIPAGAAMVKYGLNRVQLPLWLQQSLINGFSWYSLCWAIMVWTYWTSVKCAEAAWNYKSGAKCT